MRTLIERMQLAEADFSTNTRLKFSKGWADMASDFLRAVGSVLIDHLNEHGYSSHGVKMKGLTLRVSFDGDSSSSVAGGKFALGIDANHRFYPELTVRSNKGSGVKSGDVKASGGLVGMKVFNQSPWDVATEVLSRGNPSWGDLLGISD